MYTERAIQDPIVENRPHRKGDIIHLGIGVDFICDMKDVGMRYSSLSNVAYLNPNNKHEKVGGFVEFNSRQEALPVIRFATKSEWEAFFEEPYPGLGA